MVGGYLLIVPVPFWDCSYSQFHAGNELNVLGTRVFCGIVLSQTVPSLGIILGMSQFLYIIVGFCSRFCPKLVLFGS